jgi:hypothetical protein
MMYSNNFAAAIIVNNKVLREFGDIVYLPFGSEYKIRLKNLYNQRCKVNIQIDGRNVTEGGLIIDSYSTLDLERFLGNNLDKGNKFKFIERTTKVEQHRGIRVDDGIINIRYEFETPMLWSYNKPKITTYIDNPFIGNRRSLTASLYDAGITVEGGMSDQTFKTTTWNGGLLGENVINIRLLGETEDNKIIREPVTVKTLLQCKTCGTKNKTSSKFCSECGTSLQIVN